MLMIKHVSAWDRIRTVIGIIALFTALVGGILIIQREVSNRVVDLRDLPESVTEAVTVDTDNVVDSGGSIELRYYENSSSDELLVFFHGAGSPDTDTPEIASSRLNVLAPTFISDSLIPIPLNDQVLYDGVDAAISRAEKLGFEHEEITVVGFSLGGSQAIYAAAQYPDLKTVIPIATFTSFKEACKNVAGGSTCTLVSDDYLSSETIAVTATAKVHQYHSVDDKVVPFEDGRRLFSFIGSQNKEFTEITGEHSGYDILAILNENL